MNPTHILHESPIQGFEVPVCYVKTIIKKKNIRELADL